MRKAKTKTVNNNNTHNTKHKETIKQTKEA